MESHGSGHTESHASSMSSYGKLGIALTLSIITMYVLTMAFVAEASHFHLNLSNAYMGMVMVAPMGLSCWSSCAACSRSEP